MFEAQSADSDAVISELDTEAVPEALAQAFTDNSVPLGSAAPTVIVVEAGTMWLIWDGDFIYEVFQAAGSFRIRRQSDGYEVVDVPTALNARLFPWEGYWLKTLVDNLVLTFRPPAGIANVDPTLPPSFQPRLAPPVVKNLDGFELRFALTAGFASDVSTILGTHSEAKVGIDRFDTYEPPTLGQTVALYFKQQQAEEPFDTDYQPIMEVGEARIWRLTAFADQPNAEMTLSWNTVLRQIPGDIMLSFRRIDGTTGEWHDMRQQRAIRLTSDARIAEIPFEIRAERYAMSAPTDVQIVPGEQQVEIRWKPDANPFIAGYTVTRRTTNDQRPMLIRLEPNVHKFVDTSVEEETSYTYQLFVRFKSGAELQVDLRQVTVEPVIEKTSLWQNYPNPFNPEQQRQKLPSDVCHCPLGETNDARFYRLSVLQSTEI